MIKYAREVLYRMLFDAELDAKIQGFSALSDKSIAEFWTFAETLINPWVREGGEGEPPITVAIIPTGEIVIDYYDKKVNKQSTYKITESGVCVELEK